MPKFSAVVQRNHYATVTVEADNENEAHELVMDKVASDKTIAWTEEDGVTFGFRSVFVHEKKNEVGVNEFGGAGMLRPSTCTLT